MFSLLILSALALQSQPVFGLERYEIDARNSTVGFDGTTPLHDFTGKTHALHGDLRADPSDFGHLVGGAVWIDVQTLETGNGTRDKEMRELLGAKTHPQIVFLLDSVRAEPVKGRVEYTAAGRFTIKGVEKPRRVRFHIEPIPPTTPEAARELRVLGEVRFDMSDHGIKRPGALITKVADEVRVWLDLRLRPVSDAGVEARVRTLELEEEFAPSAPGAAVRKSSGTEFAWTTESALLWERREPAVWLLKNASGLSSIDPRSGRAQAPSELFQQASAALAQPAIGGTSWSASVDERDGRRTLRITFADDVPARLPAWALDPGAWSNGPSTAAGR